MSIDRSGEWRKGSEASDLKDYLQEYSSVYPMDEFRLARCECGSQVFHLDIFAPGAAARRTCVDCDRRHFLCESEKYRGSQQEAESWECLLCTGQECNVAAGFALYKPHRDIKWLYVATRCADCGHLGCVTEYKVGYGPSGYLMDLV